MAQPPSPNFIAFLTAALHKTDFCAYLSTAICFGHSYSRTGTHKNPQTCVSWPFGRILPQGYKCTEQTLCYLLLQ